MALIKKFRIKYFKKDEPLVNLKKITLSFGKRQILDNVSFSINKGEILGMLGPNGVGKSNIFDAIAYCLNMSLAPGKIRHARDLAHRLERINAEAASDES